MERKEFPFTSEPPSIQKHKHNSSCVLFSQDHQEGNDLSKLGHHIWTQAASQAEFIKESRVESLVQAEESTAIITVVQKMIANYEVHGRWPFFRKTSWGIAYHLPHGGLMKLKQTIFLSDFFGRQAVSVGIEISIHWSLLELCDSTLPQTYQDYKFHFLVS